MPTWRLVVCSQNHDQVGNRAVGDRITEALDDDQLACAALLTLCGPFTPMLFQGEEWAASTPFQFFTSHPEPELGKATAEGRIEEFARHGWDPDAVPDPQDPATFERSQLDWSETTSDRGPADAGGLPAAGPAAPRAWSSSPTRRSTAPRARSTRPLAFFTMRRGALLVLVNFGDQPLAAEVGEVELLFETESGVDLPTAAWSACPRTPAPCSVPARRRRGATPRRWREVDDLVADSAGRRSDARSRLRSKLAELRADAGRSSPSVRSILTQVVLALDEDVPGGGASSSVLVDLDDLLPVDLVGARRSRSAWLPLSSWKMLSKNSSRSQNWAKSRRCRPPTCHRRPR